MKREFEEKYASITDVGFTAKYRASCFCNAVECEVGSDPVDAKICHCLGCQKLHGATYAMGSDLSQTRRQDNKRDRAPALL